jgi:hypothetical protein
MQKRLILIIAITFICTLKCVTTPPEKPVNQPESFSVNPSEPKGKNTPEITQEPADEVLVLIKQIRGG